MLIHILGGGLWPRFARALGEVTHQPPREQDVATSDVIHLEKRAIPRPQRKRVQPLQPRPRPIAQRQPPPVPQIAVLPKPEVLRKPVVVEPKHERPAPRANPQLTHVALQKPEAVAVQKPALSSQQIAALDQQFAKTIAAARQDVTTIAQRTQSQPAAVKHYHMSFEGIHANLRRGEGTIEPTKAERIGNTMWYYTRYTFMYADGHIEEDDIPWPFHYPVGDDPFARGQHKIPLQEPPPGYRPNRPLQPILMQFFGGPPIAGG
ncbi:MAG: hypothetical protein NVS2B17_01500 [Candidatus Velthaea sp.]